MKRTCCTALCLVPVLFVTSVQAQADHQLNGVSLGLATNASSTGELKHTFRPRINVRIYNFDRIEPQVIASAKEVTSEIFRRAGLQISWLDCISQGLCAPAGSPEFRVEIVPRTIGEAMVSDGALGFAIPCASRQETCLSYILYWQIRALAENNHIRADRLLGHVIAHEIGHTLLGSSAHTHFGVMQHQLPVRETEGTLYFTSGQAKQLRTDLLAREEVLTK